MKKIINDFLLLYFGFKIEIQNPRGVVLFAKGYFKNKPLEVIEIGTWEGEHALSILKNLNVKELCCIDPYEKYEDYKHEEKYKGIEKAYRKARRRLRGYAVKWIKLKSNEAIKKIYKADLIYIDGNHKYEYVKEDINLYWDKVKPFGILGGHDFYHNSGVVKAVLEFCNKNKLELYLGKGRDWWVIKE